MVAPNPNFLCEQTRPYYYDFLHEESHRNIPESVIDHINKCANCQRRINRLNTILSPTEEHLESKQRQGGDAITVMLSLHFAYVGERVTCETVKPFFPGMLDLALEVRIPTPITTHIDNCQRCAEDLETIRELNLNRKQLYRLSQLFAVKHTKDNFSCSQARTAILTVLSMDFSEANPEVLKHLCRCSLCQRLLYEERQKICEELPECSQYQEFPCESVSPRDIFDYVMPYGLDPADNQYAESRKSLTSHAATCPNCLAKMQHLHESIYYIADRAESDVITIYHIDESAEARATCEHEDLYEGFPVRVEITSPQDKVSAETTVSTIDFGTALKQKVSAMNLKRFVKIAAVTAAAILIVVALLLDPPAATAVTIEQIYKALENARNVYISKSVHNKTEPIIEERWVSRSLNIYMSKTGKQMVFSDARNKLRKTKHLGTDSIVIEPLSGDTWAGIEKRIAGSLGLMPFYNILSDISQDVEWSRVADDSLKAAAKGIEVYDLIWIKKASDSSVTSRKWRFFVDHKTKLPQRTEFYEKSPVDSEYALVWRTIVKSLSDSEIRTVIKDAGF